MNYEDDDGDNYTCEKCGRKSYPEVGMNFCPCEGFPIKKKSDKSSLSGSSPKLRIIDDVYKEFPFLMEKSEKD